MCFSDAKTTALAWPNLSTASVSGRNLFMEPEEKLAAASHHFTEGREETERLSIYTVFTFETYMPQFICISCNVIQV